MQSRAVRWFVLGAGLLTGCANGAADVERAGDAPVVMRSASQAFEARFDARGVHLAPTAPGVEWSLVLRTVGLGCAGDARPAPDAVARATGARVEMTRARANGAAFTEWFEQRPEGLEQGFDLAARPACGDGPVVIELAASGGLVPSRAGDAVEFADAYGARVVAYGGLRVVDADGRGVPARFDVAGSLVRIVVDDRGARYPLRVDPLITNESSKLTADDGAAGDGLGSAVAVSGDTLVAGASTVGGSAEVGAAYVFVRSAAGTWTQQARLAVAGTQHFGGSVAIAGDTIVVGAPYTASFAGAVYVFTRSGTTWSRQAQLSLSGSYGQFGASVAVAGDTAIVGAPGSGGDVGAAYVFTRSGTTWTYATTLAPAMPTLQMDFGVAAAFDGTTIAIGADRANIGGVLKGSVDVYRASCLFAGSWTDEAQLIASDGNLNSFFGGAVAVDGDTVLVGASGHTFFNHRGAAYVFRRTPGSGGGCPTPTWSQEAELAASDAMDNDAYGSAVALAGDRAAIGADGRGSYAGVGYYLTRASTTWTERTSLVATDPGPIALGTGAALGTGFTALGARNAPSARASTAGAVYLFATDLAPNGTACAAASTCASGHCVDGVCCDTACGGGATNDCQACSVAAGASAAGVCTPTSGGSCDDSNGCTTGDRCSAGTCAGTGTVTCTAPVCHTAGACAPASGMCGAAVPVADGVLCAGGVCMGGACVAIDAGMDASRDAAVDAGVDAARDAAVDAGMDAAHDAGTDAAVDAANDVGVDAASDAGVDVVAVVDVGADVASDAAADGGAVVDAGSDSGADDVAADDVASGEDAVDAPVSADAVAPGDAATHDAAADGATADGSTHASNAGGCGCRVDAPRTATPRWTSWLALSGFAAVFARRRRARRTDLRMDRAQKVER